MIGRTLGHYEVVEPLGAGGMGEVYRARDTKLDRDVAIKVLPDDFAADHERLVRFEREAKLLASLNHPSIATIHGLEDADGVRFIAMELIEGGTLADKLRGDAPATEEALQIALSIAEALEAAHARGIVHRDLKPSNVMISADGRVKVLDFGLAKSCALDEMADSEAMTADIAKLTTTGVLMGTPPYMSPEQVRGQTVDERADIWAFGCLLFELLTGSSAFRRETLADTFAAIVEREPDMANAS